MLPQSSDSSNFSTSILKSGCLQFVNSINSRKCFAVVHKTSTKHFVVLYSCWSLECLKTPLFCINLKSAKVKISISNNELIISPNYEGVPIRFRICDPSDCIDSWFNAFSDGCDAKIVKQTSLKKSFQRQNSLSVLDEE